MKLRLFEIASGGVRSAVNRLQSYQTRGYGQTGDDAGSERDDEVPFIGQPIGFVSRPVIRRGLRALGLVGDDDSVSLLAMIDRAVSHATDVGEGEARVFSPQTPAVCIRLLDGLIEIKINATGELRLAPDAADYKGEPVARKTDEVQVSIAANTVLVAATGGVLNPLPITLVGTITNGALKVKA